MVAERGKLLMGGVGGMGPGPGPMGMGGAGGMGVGVGVGVGGMGGLGGGPGRGREDLMVNISGTSRVHGPPSAQATSPLVNVSPKMG